MRWISWLRSAFSRYELALLGYCLQIALFVLIVVALFRGASWLAIAIGIIVVLVGIATWVASACPVCGKPPSFFYLTDRDTEWRKLFLIGRLWPERSCSECGTRLDD